MHNSRRAGPSYRVAGKVRLVARESATTYIPSGIMDDPQSEVPGDSAADAARRRSAPAAASFAAPVNGLADGPPRGNVCPEGAATPSEAPRKPVPVTGPNPDRVT